MKHTCSYYWWPGHWLTDKTSMWLTYAFWLVSTIHVSIIYYGSCYTAPYMACQYINPLHAVAHHDNYLFIFLNLYCLHWPYLFFFVIKYWINVLTVQNYYIKCHMWEVPQHNNCVSRPGSRSLCKGVQIRWGTCTSQGWGCISHSNWILIKKEKNGGNEIEVRTLGLLLWYETSAWKPE